MMACELPVIDLKGDNTTTFFGRNYKEFIVLAERDPRSIADAIIQLLTNQKQRARLGKKGKLQVSRRTWDKAGKVVERAMKHEM